MRLTAADHQEVARGKSVRRVPVGNGRPRTSGRDGIIFHVASLTGAEPMFWELPFTAR
jgi:hypothetical protein